MTLRLVSECDPPSTSEIVAASFADFTDRIKADEFGQVLQGIVIAEGDATNIEAFGCTSVHEVIGLLEVVKAMLLRELVDYD